MSILITQGASNSVVVEAIPGDSTATGLEWGLLSVFVKALQVVLTSSQSCVSLS